MLGNVTSLAAGAACEAWKAMGGSFAGTDALEGADELSVVHVLAVVGAGKGEEELVQAVSQRASFGRWRHRALLEVPRRPR